MKFKFVSLNLILAFILLGCAKEENPITQETETDSSEMEARMNQAIEEIELDYRKVMEEVDELDERFVTYIEAGSVDALQDALDNAHRFQRIIFRSGDHYEYSTVVIEKTVHIVGEPGAVLYFDNEFPGYIENLPVKTGIHLKNASGSRIEGLDMRPMATPGTMAIFLDNSPYCKIVDNTMTDFIYPLWASNGSDRVSVYDNVLTGIGGSGWGIVIESGEKAKIMNNHSNGFWTGLFASDKDGIIYHNNLDDNVAGLLMCTVQGSVALPNGPLENAISCTDWSAVGNEASNNLWNYLVIDGANNNLLAQNHASNAGLYDIETCSETDRVGFLVPTTHDNVIISVGGSFNDLVIKQCEENNLVFGGTLVDLEEDPCW